MTIIAKLELDEKTDSGLVTYANDKVEKIEGNPNFSGISPSAADVAAKAEQYKKALAKAVDGSKADTEAKNARRKELEDILTLQANECAKMANGSLEKFLTSGYAAKDTKGQPTGELGQVTGLELDYGKNEGELDADWDTLEDADNYTYQIYTNAADPDGSKIKEGLAKKSKATISGLPSGQKVYGRVRGNGGSKDFGPWSDPAEKRVP